MSSILKSLLKKIPPVKHHLNQVGDLVSSHERLENEVESLRSRVRDLVADRARLASEEELVLGTHTPDKWAELKDRKRKLSEEFRAVASTARLTPRIEPVKDYLTQSTAAWIEQQVKAEPYWLHNIEVLPGLYTAGWSDPAREKLPYYGIPEDLTGMRVLDIGCAEGFFSFEAERRGAREVIGIDSFPDSIRRFNIVKSARQSNASAFLMNVYDLEPRRLGTFDLVLFYGVLYHLKHPQYALERIRSVCTGRLLFQTFLDEDPAVSGSPWARFCPHGMLSGRNKDLFDPTVFWLFNRACCVAMLDHVGFSDLEIVSNDPNCFVVSVRSPEQSTGVPPDQTDSPWC